MLIHELNIYPNREHGTAQFYAVQGESGARELRMDLYDAQGQPVKVVETKALLYVLKPDRNVAVIQCETVTNGKLNQVTCLLTLQAATCPGICSLLLQVLTDTGELRYDNMQLKVFPSEADAVASRSDLGPLAQIIQSSGQIETLLKETQGTAKLLESIIRDYTEELTPEVSGAIGIGDVSPYSFESAIAADTNGNMLMLDAWTWGGIHTKLSTDFCKTWQDAPLLSEDADPSAIFHLCFGGDKFLCMSNEYLLWAQVSGGKLTSGPLLANPIYKNLSPVATHGKYINGKYWIFPEQDIARTSAYPPVYFTGNGAEYVAVSLPHNQMCAQDIVYDAASGYYFLCGGYLGNSSKNGYTWVLASKNLTTWSEAGQWYDNVSYQMAALTVRGGWLTAYPDTDTGSSFTAKRIKAADWAGQDWKTVRIPLEGKFYSLKSAECEICSTVLGASDRLAYTKDGMEHVITPITWPEKIAGSHVELVGYGRRIILVHSLYYAVYRMDLVGESLVDQIETALKEIAEAKAGLETWKKGITTELETAAGRKIVLTDTDPGVGADLEPGTVLFVYEGG